MNARKTIQRLTRNAEQNGEAASEPDFIVGLDIGTTKVCCIIAAPSEDGRTCTVLGLGQSPSEGLNRGVVVNIEKTVRAIKEAVSQAEQQAGVEVDDVLVGIAGDHIQSIQATGIVAISNPDREITRQDVSRLIEDTKKIAIPSDRRILHVIPQDFIIDGQDGISDPVGMSGIRMEGNVHVVTGLVTALQNIYRCVERAGYQVRDLVLEPIASSHAIFEPEEMEIGVALIDIGGGTTDIAIFDDGIIRYTSIIGIAARQVTEDIRRGLGIINSQAERIKRSYGHAYADTIMRDEIFMIPAVGGRQPMEVSKSVLCQIIQPRMEEILEFAFAEIKRSGFLNQLSAGLVLTGGGALLRGTQELARDIFDLPVKLGIPNGFGEDGLTPEVGNPQFATGMGLIRYAMNRSYDDYSVHQPLRSTAAPAEEDTSAKPGVFDRVKSFFQEL